MSKVNKIITIIFCIILLILLSPVLLLIGIIIFIGILIELIDEFWNSPSKDYGDDKR